MRKDIILETYRRSEFIVFLLNCASFNKRPKPGFLTANEFRIDKTHIVDFQINKDVSMRHDGLKDKNYPVATK